MQFLHSREIAALELFDSRIQKIHSRSFIRKYEESKNLVTITATKTEDKWDIQTAYRRADDESVDAVVLTLRFFILDNESCSLRNLHRIYNETDCLSELADDFNARRGHIDDFLSRRAEPKKQGDEPITYRDILDAFVFGDLAHTNNENARKRYVVWHGDPMTSAMFTHMFHHIAYEIFAVCAEISRINAVALSRLRSE